MNTSIYCIDTSTLIDLWRGVYSRDVHKSLWSNIERYIKEGQIVSSIEVHEEIKIDTETEFKEWIKENKSMFIEIDEDQISKTKEILEKYPLLSEGFQGKADPILVAVCLTKGYVLLTSEKHSPTSSPYTPKIPNLCDDFGVACVDINNFCRRENIQI